jgi:hypothetical protein
MTKSDHHKPINFVGLYFIDEERYETGQIIAEISDGYFLAQFDCIEKGAPPPRLEVLSSVEFNKLCDSCGSRHWRFFAMLKVERAGWFG